MSTTNNTWQQEARDAMTIGINYRTNEVLDGMVQRGFLPTGNTPERTLNRVLNQDPNVKKVGRGLFQRVR